MPLKLTSGQDDEPSDLSFVSENLHEQLFPGKKLLVGKLTDSKINKTAVKEMVGFYRDKHALDADCLKFIHFNLKEVMELFIANDYIDPAVPVQGQLRGLKDVGVKIYLATHKNELDCPTPPSPAEPNPYMLMDTAIICNTELNPKNGTWEDQLDDTPDAENLISVIGFGDGIDRGAICPPNCPGTLDADGFYHQDIYP